VVAQYFTGRLVDIAGYEVPFVGASIAYLLAIALLLLAGKIEPIRAKPI